MECLKDWNEAALHFTSCYLLMKMKEKKFTLPHTAANFVCIEQLSIIINNDLMAMQSSTLLKEEVFTFYNSFKRK